VVGGVLPADARAVVGEMLSDRELRSSLGREASGTGRTPAGKDVMVLEAVPPVMGNGEGSHTPARAPPPLLSPEQAATAPYVCHVCYSNFHDEDTMWVHVIQAHVSSQPPRVPSLQQPSMVLGPLGEMLALQFLGLTAAASQSADHVNTEALTKLMQLAAYGGAVPQLPLPGMGGEIWGSAAFPFGSVPADPQGTAGVSDVVVVNGMHGISGPVPISVPVPSPIRRSAPSTSAQVLTTLQADGTKQVRSDYRGRMPGHGIHHANWMSEKGGLVAAAVARPKSAKGVAADATRVLIPVHAAGLRRKERRFPCPACPRNYASRSGLWMHTRSVHHGLRHQCESCLREFPFQSGLITHACTRAPLDVVTSITLAKRRPGSDNGRMGAGVAGDGVVEADGAA